MPVRDETLSESRGSHKPGCGFAPQLCSSRISNGSWGEKASSDFVGRLDSGTPSRAGAPFPVTGRAGVAVFSIKRAPSGPAASIRSVRLGNLRNEETRPGLHPYLSTSGASDLDTERVSIPPATPWTVVC